MENRYYVAKGEELLELINDLELKGYVQLPDAGREMSKLIIDTKNRTFWMLGQNCFANNVAIIKDTTGQEVKKLDNHNIKNL